MRIVAGVHTLEQHDPVILPAAGGDVKATIIAIYPGGRCTIENTFGARLGCHVDDLLHAPTTAAPARIVLTHTQGEVLAAIVEAGTAGLIDHDHVDINRLTADQVPTHRDPLVKQGLVVDAPQRRPSPRGRPTTVWTATAAGIALHQTNRRKGIVA